MLNRAATKIDQLKGNVGFGQSWARRLTPLVRRLKMFRESLRRRFGGENNPASGGGPPPKPKTTTELVTEMSCP